MASPTKLTVTYLVYSGASPTVMTTASATIAIPASLQALDGSSGQSSAQSGYSAADVAARNLFRGGCFSPDGGVTYIPINQVVSVVAS